MVELGCDSRYLGMKFSFWNQKLYNLLLKKLPSSFLGTVPEIKLFEPVLLDYDMFKPPTPDSDIDRMREIREKKEKINTNNKIADNKKKDEENLFE